MTSHLTLRQRAAQYWNRNLTGWTAHSPTAAAISQVTASGRAYITVASLLAFFARPQEMPIYREMSIPGALLADRERWRDRPVMRWVVAQYQAHRQPKPAAV
jgi:hypothetical protein